MLDRKFRPEALCPRGFLLMCRLVVDHAVRGDPKGKNVVETEWRSHIKFTSVRQPDADSVGLGREIAGRICRRLA